MANARVLAIEGVPGTGKSSAAMALAARYGARHMTLPTPFRVFREEIDLDGSLGPLTRTLYYLAATSHMAEEVDAARPVIFDRWLPSVLGLVEAGDTMSRQTLAEVAVPIVQLLPRPRLTVVLTAEPRVVRLRIETRNKEPLHVTPAHVLAGNDPGFLDRWNQAIVHWSSWLGPSRVIDTTSMGESDVARTIGELWQDHGHIATPDW